MLSFKVIFSFHRSRESKIRSAVSSSVISKHNLNIPSPPLLSLPDYPRSLSMGSIFQKDIQMSGIREKEPSRPEYGVYFNPYNPADSCTQTGLQGKFNSLVDGIMDAAWFGGRNTSSFKGHRSTPVPCSMSNKIAVKAEGDLGKGGLQRVVAHPFRQTRSTASRTEFALPSLPLDWIENRNRSPQAVESPQIIWIESLVYLIETGIVVNFCCVMKENFDCDHALSLTWLRLESRCLCKAI